MVNTSPLQGMHAFAEQLAAGLGARHLTQPPDPLPDGPSISFSDIENVADVESVGYVSQLLCFGLFTTDGRGFYVRQNTIRTEEGMKVAAEVSQRGALRRSGMLLLTCKHEKPIRSNESDALVRK